jgi:hypothetical protein
MTSWRFTAVAELIAAVLQIDSGVPRHISLPILRNAVIDDAAAGISDYEIDSLVMGAPVNERADGTCDYEVPTALIQRYPYIHAALTSLTE